MDVARSCARPGCGEQAAAVLSYNYGESTAWVDDLVGETEPSSHPLCAAHADGFRVPRGWSCHDRRTSARRYRPAIAV